MAKTEIKTRPTDTSVEAFLNSVADEQQRAESFRILEMFKRVTGEEPVMWGPAIVGFGSRLIKYESGRELDWMITGFSPRKGNHTLYVLCGSKKEEALLAKLGKYKTGKSCLYIKRLSYVDEAVVEQLIAEAIKHPGC